MPASTLLALISDTHGLLRPQVPPLLRSAAHIIHAGDVGTPEVLAALRALAPVTAIRGNVDRGPWAAALPETATVSIAGLRIHVLHDLKQLALDPRTEAVDVVVSGHSHKPAVRDSGGILYINPGAAGPRRFRLPITLAFLDPSLRPLAPVFYDLERGAPYPLN